MTNSLRPHFVYICLSAILAAGAVHVRAEIVEGAAPSMQAHVARRVIPLEGQSNFRDLGGYETTDGRYVKWGMIFRSGELSHLTAADYDRIRVLHVRTVYDLRDQNERAGQPTHWDAGAVQVLVSAKSNTVSSTMATLSDPNVDAARARAALAEFYGRMPRLYASEYRAIFQELLAGDAPLLLHCTAGKDRSGLASALILSALGVPRTTIAQDYELTDQLLKAPSPAPQTEFMRRFQRLAPDVQHAMMSADPEYLEAAYAAIESQYGSLDHYFAKALDVGPAQIKQLRALYLEP
jgi:protein-tyrosine phosphatase